MEVALGGLIGAVLLGFVLAGRAYFGSGTDLAGDLRIPGSDEVRQLRAELGQLSPTWDRRYAQVENWRNDLTTAVDLGIRHVDRVENRVRGVVRRAREELADGGITYPALEAEASELRTLDGEGGGAEEVQPVPAGVEGSRRAALRSLPGGWTEEDLRALGA